MCAFSRGSARESQIQRDRRAGLKLSFDRPADRPHVRPVSRAACPSHLEERVHFVSGGNNVRGLGD